MSNSNTQINFISSSVVKFLKKKFNYDESFDTIISLLIITCITNIYGISSYINEENIKQVFNNDEFINNLKYGITFIFIPCFKLLICIYILYYIKKKEYYKFVYRYFYNNRNKLELISNVNVIEDKTDNEIINYTIDISNLPNQINIIYKFMDFHPEFFKRDVSYKLINYINCENETQLYPVFEGSVKFNDPIHNVYGYISTNYSNVTNSKNELIHNYNMKVSLNKTNNDNKISKATKI